jgi:hypothetical protein
VTRPTLEPRCPERQDLRSHPRRVAEFDALIDAGAAPELRAWMIWMNELYTYNCTLARKKPR